MMEKQVNKKLIIALAASAVLLSIAGALIFAVTKKQTYRLIKVYEVEGKAIVARQEQGELAAYVNMVLQSGDRVSTSDGRLTLRMDEDKYAYLEPQSQILLEASGNQKNGKTAIVLEEGALLNEIQNPLAESASYEVNTPNSTMSVRGTVFYVAVYTDEQGVKYTKITVVEGKVSSKLVYQDGTAAQDDVMIEAGKEAIIYEDGKTTDYLNGVQDIDYAKLPESVIRTLIVISENGRTLAISTDDLRKYLPESTTEEVTTEEVTTEAQTTEEQTTETQTTEVQTTEEVTTEAQTTEEQTTEEKTTEEKTYTVTFQYNGSVFGTQKVKEGETASKPKLKPAKSGSWNYDFTKPVTADVTVTWK